MFFAGIDAHTRYVVVVIINKMGERGSAASAALRQKKHEPNFSAPPPENDENRV